MSNNICEFHGLSAFKMAKEFKRHFVDRLGMVPSDLFDVHSEHAAERKLFCIMRSRTTENIPISVADIVEVFARHANENKKTFLLLGLFYLLISLCGQSHSSQEIKVGVRCNWVCSASD